MKEEQNRQDHQDSSVNLKNKYKLGKVSKDKQDPQQHSDLQEILSHLKKKNQIYPFAKNIANLYQQIKDKPANKLEFRATISKQTNKDLDSIIFLLRDEIKSVKQENSKEYERKIVGVAQMCENVLKKKQEDKKKKQEDEQKKLKKEQQRKQTLRIQPKSKRQNKKHQDVQNQRKVQTREIKFSLLQEISHFFSSLVSQKSKTQKDSKFAPCYQNSPTKSTQSDSQKNKHKMKSQMGQTKSLTHHPKARQTLGGTRNNQIQQIPHQKPIQVQKLSHTSTSSGVTVVKNNNKTQKKKQEKEKKKEEEEEEKMPLYDKNRSN